MEKKLHPCPHHIENTKSCNAFNNWWNGEPARCEYTPEQLLHSKPGSDDYCSVFPGSFRRIDGSRIHPSQLNNLAEVAKGADRLQSLLETLLTSEKNIH